MPFRVTKDGATIPKDTGTRKALRTGVEFKIYSTTVYKAGDLLTDDEVAQVVKDKYNDGDERVRSLIEEISEKEYEDGVSVESTGFLDRWQAENAGPVDEPRKTQQAITKLDVEYNDPEKGKVVEAATATSGDEGVALSEDSNDEPENVNEVGVEGGGPVDEPTKVDDAPTGNELKAGDTKGAKAAKKGSAKSK